MNMPISIEIKELKKEIQSLKEIVLFVKDDLIEKRLEGKKISIQQDLRCFT